MRSKCLFKIFKIKYGYRFFTKAEKFYFPESLNQAFSSSIHDNLPADKFFEKNKSDVETYYRQYLLNNLQYINLIFRFECTEANTKTAEILNQMCQFKEDNIDMNNQLSYHLDKEASHFNFSELCNAVFLILKFRNQNKNDPFWESILHTIEKECFNRMSTYTTDEMVKLNDATMVYSIPLRLKNKLMYKLCRKSSTSNQVTALFYFLMKKKFLIPKEDVFNLQEKVKEIIPEINFHEAGIIAEGFLKSFSCLRNSDLHFGILMKAVEEKDIINQIPFNSICKFARRLSNYTNSKGIPKFQETLIDTALKFGKQNIIKLALSGQKINYLNSNLKTALMKEVKDHIKELPIFYIERVAYISTKVNIRDDEFLKMAVEALEREGLTEINTQFFLLLLNHLTHYQIYPKHLLALIFKQDFVDNILKEKLVSVSAWWQIYCSIEIEKPDCLTSFDLTPKARNKIYQSNKVNHILQRSKHYSILRKAQNALIEVFGEGFVNFCIPLPHYLMGLLIRFDKNSKPQQLPEEFVPRKGFLIKPLQDDHIWMFIIVIYFLDQADFSKKILNMVTLTQIRQLQALGYTPLLAYKSFKLNKDHKEYFKNLINVKLEECCKKEKSEIFN